MRDYPSWTCHECAIKAGGKVVEGHLATWHYGTCDVCNDKKGVTEPRDYRYPNYERSRDDKKS